MHHTDDVDGGVAGDVEDDMRLLWIATIAFAGVGADVGARCAGKRGIRRPSKAPLEIAERGVALFRAPGLPRKAGDRLKIGEGARRDRDHQGRPYDTHPDGELGQGLGKEAGASGHSPTIAQVSASAGA